MNKTRYLTTVTRTGLEEVRSVCTEQDNYKEAVHLADEWVWQYADSPKQALYQHDSKMDDMETNPNKDTY